MQVKVSKMEKKAVITVRLVAESAVYSDKTLAAEILSWLRENPLPLPWAKEVEGVVVQDA
jgi:hypothetical protein